MSKTLRDLKPKESGIIVKLGGQSDLRRRFMDMGITRGTQVLIEKVAPLGDPIEIKVKGYNLTIRKADAEKIEIE